jgi:hypothetical protein
MTLSPSTTGAICGSRTFDHRFRQPSVEGCQAVAQLGCGNHQSAAKDISFVQIEGHGGILVMRASSL